MNKESEYYNGVYQLNDNIGNICEITDPVIDGHPYKVEWDYKGATEFNCYHDYAEAFVYRLQEHIDTPRDKWTVWVDRSDNRWRNLKLASGLIDLCNRQAGKPITDKAWDFFREKIKSMDMMDEKFIDSFIQSHFFSKDTIKPIYDYMVVQHSGVVIRAFSG
jgi:hypothetical protein